MAEKIESGPPTHILATFSDQSAGAIGNGRVGEDRSGDDAQSKTEGQRQKTKEPPRHKCQQWRFLPRCSVDIMIKFYRK